MGLLDRLAPGCGRPDSPRRGLRSGAGTLPPNKARRGLRPLAALLSPAALLSLTALLTVAVWTPPLCAADAAANAGNSAHPQPGLQVVSSGPHAVRFASGVLVPVWSARAVRSGLEPFYDLSVPGFTTFGAPGQVRTPRTGAWVVVPPGTRPVVRVVEEAWEPAQGRRLMVESVPVFLPQSGSDTPFVSEILVLPGEPLPQDVQIPQSVREALDKSASQESAGQEAAGQARTQAVTLGEVAWWRGRRVAAVQVVPVKHDNQGRAQAVLRSGTWEIAFVPDPAAAAGGAGKAAFDAKGEAGDNLPLAGKLTTRGDDRFGQIFLNPELLQTQPTEGAFAGVLPALGGTAAVGLDKAAALLAPEVRLAVRETKLQRVTAARLRERSLLPQTAIREDQIRLYQRRYAGTTGSGSTVEVEVPILMFGEGDLFDGDDYFVFYGLRLRDDGDYVADLGEGQMAVPGCGDPFEMNNKANLYWLAAAEPPVGAAWARMEPVTLPAAAGAPLSSYRRSDHYEEQVSFRENLPLPDEDRLYQNVYTAMEAKVGISPLWTPDPGAPPPRSGSGTPGGASLRGWCASICWSTTCPRRSWAPRSPWPRWSRWNRCSPCPRPCWPPARPPRWSWRPDEGSTGLYSYLNWVKIAYDARYQGRRRQTGLRRRGRGRPAPHHRRGVRFRGRGAGRRSPTPGGPARWASAWRISSRTGQTFTLSVMPEQTTGTRTFSAVGGWLGTGVAGIQLRQLQRGDRPAGSQTWTGPGQPDLLVVTHAEFRQAIGRWITHRQGRAKDGLGVHVVEVQDLYDWYSGGLRDPWAIKRFGTHAIREWESWSLVIVGDANENALGKRVGAAARGWATDWVPTHYHTQRALSYEPELMAADKWYATSRPGCSTPGTTTSPPRSAAPGTCTWAASPATAWPNWT